MNFKIVADENIPFVENCFSSIGKVTTAAGREMTSELVSDSDILLVRSVTRVDEKLLADSSVKFVATATIGIDHIDADYLAKNNIGFASAPGSNANSVAEYIVAALLKIGRIHDITLHGKSIGVVGVGNVGSKVANKCQALGMRVLLNDPPLQRKTGDTKYLPIEKLYNCDFVTFHTPLTFDGIDRTFHLADKNFFKSIKPGCVFLNTSRGGVVDTKALKNTIKSGKLIAVALDVWESEPNIDIELLNMVDIATPHIAGYSFDGKVVGMIMIYRAACDYFNLETEFDANSFLPEPVVKQLCLNGGQENNQDKIRCTVKKIYDIGRDDADLRKIINEPEEKRGADFSLLRRNYPVRREFQNTLILGADGILQEKLAGIGFRI